MYCVFEIMVTKELCLSCGGGGLLLSCLFVRNSSSAVLLLFFFPSSAVPTVQSFDCGGGEKVASMHCAEQQTSRWASFCKWTVLVPGQEFTGVILSD